MTEYKCIACGHVKESEDTCSCTECGYKMFPTPYDRKTVLASEIQNFIKHIRNCIYAHTIYHKIKHEIFIIE